MVVLSSLLIVLFLMEMEKEEVVQVNKNTVASNVLWRFLERFGAYIVSFVVSVILARLLDPQAYGTVAIMTVFVGFFDIFVTGGFANSLIHDKKATDKDFNTILIFNICFALILYAVLFFCSPLIASYYNNNSLTWLIRVAALSLFTNGVKNIQHAYLAKRLLFKKFFLATIVGTIISGVVGIVLAFKGFGPWALVIQGVLNYFIDSVILWFTMKWKPKIEFSFSLLKKHLKFGWKILTSKVFYSISNSIRSLFIGKQYSSADLAFYNKGKTYPNIFGQNITPSINSVIFPVLTRAENDLKRFNHMLRQSFKINMFVILPIMVGLACVSDSFIRLLIGSKWLECVPYLRVFCIIVVFNTVESIFGTGPMSLGKSGLNMILDILECIVSVSLLLIFMRFGVFAIAISMLISSIFNASIYIFCVKKMTGFRILDCVKESFDSLAAAILMGVLVYSLGRLSLPYYLVLLIQVIAGIFTYFSLSTLFNNKALPYCVSIAKNLLFKKKKNEK